MVKCDTIKGNESLVYFLAHTFSKQQNASF